jgi:hypothetical protein
MSRPVDLTAMWKALEADARLIDSLVTPMVAPGSVPKLEDLQRTVTALRHFQVGGRGAVGAGWLPMTPWGVMLPREVALLRHA